MRNIGNNNQGVTTVREFNNRISLGKFVEAVARAEGIREWQVPGTYTSEYAKSALYKVEVTRKNFSQWLYLFVPKSRNGKSFYAITRSRINADDEGTSSDLRRISGVTFNGMRL